MFKRLGLDLLAVDPSGLALVHASTSRVEQLLNTAEHLSREGPREQARWISVDSFGVVPESSRIDSAWLSRLSPGQPIDAVVELQPLLSRSDIEQVLGAIRLLLEKRGVREQFSRMGTDFSGRHWYRGMLSDGSLRVIASELFSVQALHPPLQTAIALSSDPEGESPETNGQQSPKLMPFPVELPVVAVVDVGTPLGHAILAPYRRGIYTSPDAPSGLVTEHGSRVASRVVFGDPDFTTGVRPIAPSCTFIDVNVAEDYSHIDDKAVLPALQGVVAAYPDARVFNLSFGDHLPLDAHDPVQRRERLLLLQDLDNFIFRNDVVVVVAAGNSPPGVQPTPPYPQHADDPKWALGSWACGFNTIKCGAYVGRLSAEGLVANLRWPSPFTRIGPGLCGASMPEFSANGGNCGANFQPAPGLGVWACSAAGRWEDYSGTSLAAPLLAREAAFALAKLQRNCEQGARPFAATVKAFLAITALPPPDTASATVNELISRTLGRGTASSDRLSAPSPEDAILVWQGILAGPDEKARVQVPVPAGWLRMADEPELRVLVAWETPTNEAATNLWASRRVDFQLRPWASARALNPSGRSHRSYPLLDRTFNLSAALKLTPPPGDALSDLWMLELSYHDLAEYTPTMEFSPHQRLGVAMCLRDVGAKGLSPQAALQALPAAVTMTRLSIPENRIPNPVIVRVRT